MGKFIKEVDTGSFHVVTRFFFIPRRINGEWAWGKTNVRQKLVICYTKKGIMEFGEPVPHAHKVWRDVSIVKGEV